MNYQTALKILGLADPPKSSEVKRAFREKALRYHPDRNPDNEEAEGLFRTCTEAYNYLVEHSHEWRSKLESERSDRKVGDSGVGRVEDFSDIFDDIFEFSKNERILGVHEPDEVNLSLSELVLGITKRVKLSTFERCAACSGSGADKGSVATICTYCFGSGQIKTGLNSHRIVKLCPRCGGRGRKIRKVCLQCDGLGRKKISTLQELTLHPGMKPGMPYTIRAHRVDSHESTQVHIRVKLIGHPLFRIDQSDILCEYPIGESLAGAGGEVDFPTIGGRTRLTILPASHEGDVITLRGFGIVSDVSSGERGDLIIRLKVTSDKQYLKGAREFYDSVSKGNRAYDPLRRPWWKKIL